MLRKIGARFWERNKILQFYFLAFFLLGIDSAAFMVYGPMYLPKMGETSLIKVSWLLGIPSFTSLLAQNLWGYSCLLGDRFKTFLIVAFLAFTVLFGLLWQGVEFSTLFIYLFIYGIFFCAVVPTAQTLLSLLIPDRKAEVLGKLWAFESFGWALGAPLLGFLLEFWGETRQAYEFMFLFLFVLNILIVIFFALRFPASVSGLDWSQIGRSDYRGYFRVFKQGRLVALFLFVLLIGTGSTLLFFFFGRYVDEVLHGSARHLGVCMAIAALLGGISFPLIGRLADKKGIFIILLLCWFGYFLDFLLLLLINKPWWFVVVYAAPLYSFLIVGGTGMVATLTEERDRGIGFGLFNAFWSIGGVLAPLIGGFIFEYYPLSDLPFIALIAVIIGAIFLPWLREPKRPVEAV